MSDNIGMETDDPSNWELTLNRFHRLIREILQGETRRTVFQPWEVEILVDIEECRLEQRRRARVLRGYLRAVERQLELGPGPPMKLSKFLEIEWSRAPEA